MLFVCATFYICGYMEVNKNLKSKIYTVSKLNICQVTKLHTSLMLDLIREWPLQPLVLLPRVCTTIKFLYNIYCHPLFGITFLKPLCLLG